MNSDDESVDDDDYGEEKNQSDYDPDYVQENGKMSLNFQ